ncbi:hypothetical protein T06_16452 [Trichinella sp. T6]|nr:hypothetical protein T06_16452 [Trichinella sp. T6]
MEPADLSPGPRQFVRRRCVLVRSRSLGLVSSSTSSEHASTRTTRPHVGQRSRSGKDPSCSSPLQYIEGFRRRRLQAARCAGAAPTGYQPPTCRRINDQTTRRTMAGWEVLLPRLRVYLSQTCNEQRHRIAGVFPNCFHTGSPKTVPIREDFAKTSKVPRLPDSTIDNSHCWPQ